MNRVLKDSTLYLVGNVASRGVGFLAIPFYARFLTPAQYGIIELIELSTQIIAIAFGLQSIGQALSRLFHEQRTPDRQRDVVSTGIIANVMLSGVVTLAAILAAAPASAAIFHSADHTSLLRAALVAMFFANLVEVALVYQRIRERARFFLAYSLVTLLVNLGLNIYFIGFAGAGVWGFVCSKLIVTTGGSAYLLWHIGQEVGWRWRGEYVPAFVRFGAPLALSGLAYFAIHFSDRFFLNSAVSLAELGKYALAYRFALLVSVLVGDSFAKSWNVTFYRYAGEAGWRDRFARVAKYLVFVLCATALGIAVLGPELLGVMVPPAFYPPALLLPILLLSYVVRELGDFFRNLLLINKRSGRVGQIALGGALFNCVLNSVLIPRYGLYGAAVATLATWVAYMLVCWLLAHREHRVPVRAESIVAIFLLTVVIYGAAAACRLPPSTQQAVIDVAWIGLFVVLCLAFYFSAPERGGIYAAARTLAGYVRPARVFRGVSRRWRTVS